eukprot:350946-Chlamydomonas_euryale.AAC.4
MVGGGMCGREGPSPPPPGPPNSGGSRGEGEGRPYSDNPSAGRWWNVVEVWNGRPQNWARRALIYEISHVAPDSPDLRDLSCGTRQS